VTLQTNWFKNNQLTLRHNDKTTNLPSKTSQRTATNNDACTKSLWLMCTHVYT